MLLRLTLTVAMVLAFATGVFAQTLADPFQLSTITSKDGTLVALECRGNGPNLLIELMKGRPDWASRVAGIDIQIREIRALPNRTVFMFEGEGHNAMDTIPRQSAEVVTKFQQAKWVVP